MPRLSRAQGHAREEIARLESAPLLPEALGSKLLAALDLAIPNDGQSLCGIDPDSLLLNRLLAIDLGGVNHFDNYLHRIYLVKELGNTATPTLMRASLPVVVLRDQMRHSYGLPRELLGDVSERQHYSASRERDLPEGGVLRGCFAAMGRWRATIDMVRDDPRRPFQAGDAAFLRLVAPAIGRAVQASFVRERALLRQSTTDELTSGVILVSAEGDVRMLTPAAATWADALRDSWRPLTDGEPRLPVAVRAAIAGHRTRGEPVGNHSGDVHASTSAGPVRIETSTADSEGSIVVVLTPVRPSGLPAIPEDWPVTSGERSVLALVARGLSNRQIAISLYVTQNTVQTHLRHAYEKLGVSSRAQLMARLFQDAYLPGFRVPPDQGAVSEPAAPIRSG